MLMRLLKKIGAEKLLIAQITIIALPLVLIFGNSSANLSKLSYPVILPVQLLKLIHVLQRREHFTTMGE